jgi:NTP pyrophosphatase (non-canonical NTP hydrolase)
MSSEDTDPFEAVLQTKKLIREWLVTIYREEIKQTLADVKFLRFALGSHVHEDKEEVMSRLVEKKRKCFQLHRLLTNISC